MAFFTSAVNILQTLVVAIGAGLGVWGVINLMEGYGNDNPDNDVYATWNPHVVKQRLNEAKYVSSALRFVLIPRRKEFIIHAR